MLFCSSANVKAQKKIISKTPAIEILFIILMFLLSSDEMNLLLCYNKLVEIKAFFISNDITLSIAQVRL